MVEYFLTNKIHLKIKTKLFYVCVVGFIVFAFVSSCGKDEKVDLGNVESSSINRNTITVVNGMLSFATYSEFEQYQENLRIQEEDPNVIQTAYQTLGIDLNGDIPNLTDHPVCLLSDNQFNGFYSLRKSEEVMINIKLDNGEDVFSMVLFPYLKCALNQNKSVKIGSRIFTFYDNFAVSIVMNNDWVLYNNIKNMPFENLKMKTNLYIAENNKSTWSDIYNIDSNGNILSEKNFTFPSTPTESSMACDFSDLLKYTILIDGNVRVELLNSNYDIYKWNLSNGTSINGGSSIIFKYDPNGWANLCVFELVPSNPSGVRQICCGTIYFKECGIRNIKTKKIENNGINRQVEAAIWVTASEIGTSTKVLAKKWGKWKPVKGNISATFNGVAFEKKANECIPHFKTKTNSLPSDFIVDAVERPANNLFGRKDQHTSANKVKVGTTTFGFGDGTNPLLSFD